LLFYWSAGFGTFLQVPALASHWLEDCANFTPTLEETTTTALLMKYKQQANPLLSTHNYIPLVISGNDKNEQITLLSQRKLALIGITSNM
jgi:hypothetical protein